MSVESSHRACNVSRWHYLGMLSIQGQHYGFLRINPKNYLKIRVGEQLETNTWMVKKITFRYIELCNIKTHILCDLDVKHLL